MALDLTLPATGLTKHGDLYRVLRDNFNAINDKYTAQKYYVSLSTGFTPTATDPVFYYVDGAGYVHLFGSGSVSSCPSNGFTFFTFPSGHRPDNQLIFKNRVYFTQGSNGPYGNTLEINAYDYNSPGVVSTGYPIAYSNLIIVSFNGIVFKGV